MSKQVAVWWSPATLHSHPFKIPKVMPTFWPPGVPPNNSENNNHTRISTTNNGAIHSPSIYSTSKDSNKCILPILKASMHCWCHKTKMDPTPRPVLAFRIVLQLSPSPGNLCKCQVNAALFCTSYKLQQRLRDFSLIDEEKATHDLNQLHIQKHALHQ